MAIAETPILTPVEEDQIRRAVEAAERDTTGEIVAMIVRASGRYVDTRYRVAGLAALVALISVLTLGGEPDAGWWSTGPGVRSILVVVAAYGGGFVCGMWAPIIRLFTPDVRLQAKVDQRARSAFVHHRLAATRDRTAVLILVSLLEHRVQLLADKAIDERVPPGTWQGVIQTVVRGIKAGHLSEALCNGIRECGDILARHLPATPGDNPNELPDRPILGRP